MWSRLDHITDWRGAARGAIYCPKSLAQHCNVSLRQLERYFKIQFRQSPQAWLRALRMQEARRLLSEGLSSKAAAFELGFKQASHFSREFKRAAGMSPVAFAYRREDSTRRQMSPSDH